MTGFDWSVLQRTAWTPVSRLGLSGERVSDGLLRTSTPGVFLLTRARDGQSPDDPGLGAVLWARSEAVALAYYDMLELPDDLGDAPPPPVGFEPLTWGAALDHERRGRERPQHSATYRFTDGRFVHSVLRGTGREYVSPAVEPADDDPVVAVSFKLKA